MLDYYGIISSLLCLIPFTYFIINRIYSQDSIWVLVYLIYAITIEILSITDDIFKLGIMPYYSIFLSFSIEIAILYSMYYMWSKNYRVLIIAFLNTIYWCYCLFSIENLKIDLVLGWCLIFELLTGVYLLITNRRWLFNWQIYIVLAFLYYQTTAFFCFGFITLYMQVDTTLGQFLQGFSNIGLYTIITLGLIQCKKQLSVQ
jgi:hypothetical protein